MRPWFRSTPSTQQIKTRTMAGRNVPAKRLVRPAIAMTVSLRAIVWSNARHCAHSATSKHHAPPAPPAPHLATGGRHTAARPASEPQRTKYEKKLLEASSCHSSLTFPSCQCSIIPPPFCILPSRNISPSKYLLSRPTRQLPTRRLQGRAATAQLRPAGRGPLPLAAPAPALRAETLSAAVSLAPPAQLAQAAARETRSCRPWGPDTWRPASYGPSTSRSLATLQACRSCPSQYTQP